MSICLKDLIKIDANEYVDWTICLNNANEEGIYSFDEDKLRLLEHISWKKNKNSPTSFGILTQNIAYNLLG